MTNMEKSLGVLSDITVFSKYARHLSDKQRREIWEELTWRNLGMHLKKYPFLENELMDIYRGVLDKKELPSMRSVQFAGRAIELNNARIYNCFKNTTAFITNEGVKTFNDFKDGDNINVLTHLGNWKNAVVKNYGVQKLNKITIKRGRNEIVEYATPNHRWLLSDGSETTSLKKGDCLMSAPSLFEKFNYDNTEPFDKVSNKTNALFIVKNIEKFNKEEVWCLEVEDDKSFVLSSGISTGNCAYLPMSELEAFQEVMFLLLGGTGVGYSVQKHHVSQLPPLIGPSNKSKKYVVSDSIVGWADAVKTLVSSYFKGKPAPRFDFSDIRPKGTLLVTAGGKAPGPAPLKTCLHQIKQVFDSVIEERGLGTSLKPIEAHDINCHIADSVLSGGIRRAAMISLFSYDDKEMLECKFGSWWERNPQRQRANNSVVMVRSKANKKHFDWVWERVRASNSGEPGIYWTNDKDLGTNPCCFAGKTKILTENGYIEISRMVDKQLRFVNVKGELVNGTVWSNGFKKTIKLTLSNGNVIVCTPDHVFMDMCGDEIEAKDTFDKLLKSENGFAVTVEEINDFGFLEVFDFSLDDDTHWGVVEGVIAHNCEISLKPYQFCNLTTVNGSTVENQEDFNNRVYSASCIGTLQASYTDFNYLRDCWKETTEEDALIGVSITGIGSGKLEHLDLEEAAVIAKKTNEEFSKMIGINPAARVTTIKPEGSGSLVVGSSSGIHAWYAPYYIRRMRFNKDEAIYSYLKRAIPNLVEDEFFKPETEGVVSIPVKAPEGAIYRYESAIDLLERTKKYHDKWIKPGHVSGVNTNNVSVTVSIKDDEWENVGKWMWDNRNSYNGISVLPYDGGSYVQAPFEEITEETYNELIKYVRNIDLTKVKEVMDSTNLNGEVACSGGSCEVTHI